MKKYMPVINYIITNANGKKNAIIGRKIGNVFGITDVNVRAYVNEARCDGMPICSCGSGYYYSSHPADLNDTIANLKGRVMKVEMAIDGLNSIMTCRGSSK